MVIKNYREKHREELERKVSLNLPSQQATARKKRKMTLSSSKVESPLPAIGVDNEEAAEYMAGDAGR